MKRKGRKTFYCINKNGFAFIAILSVLCVIKISF